MEILVACPKCGAQLTHPEDRPRMILQAFEEVQLDCESCTGSFTVSVRVM